MIFSKVYFLLFCIFGFSKCQSVSEYPKWPTNCSFTIYEGKTVLADNYNITTNTTEKECESQCGGDTRCGMYRWEISGDNTCKRFQHSTKMWEDIGVSVDDMLQSTKLKNTGSKDCKEHVITPDCKKFTYHDRRRPSQSSQITLVQINRSPVTPDMCKDLCNLYNMCEGVAYLRWELDITISWCWLYSNSTLDVKEDCNMNETDCGTYQRNCQVTTTTPGCGATSINLSLLVMVGMSLVLPLILAGKRENLA